MVLLGQLLRQAREANRMGLEQVARKLGYRNAAKGVRKLKVIEATGTVNDEILVRLADTLGIDWALLEDVIECLHHFDFVAYILAALRNAGFANAQEREQAAHDVVVYLLVQPGQLFAG